MLAFSCFLGLTIWRVVFQGILEKPSLDAPHLEAGTGDLALIAQLLLAMGAFAFAAAWFFVESRWTRKSQSLVLAFVIPALFLFSTRGLQRFGPRYSEKEFQRLAASCRSETPIQSTDVIAAIGEPLIRMQLPDGGEKWLYSYMPSCGFGWDKKYVDLGPKGSVADIYSFSEP